MENITTVTPAKAAMPFGLLFGLIMIVEFVAMYVMDIDPMTNQSAGMIMNLFNYLIFPVAFIVIACNTYKKQHAGFASFGECLKIGVIICVIAGLLAALFSVVFNMIFPEYMDEMFARSREMMLEQNPEMTEDQVDMALSIGEKFKNPLIAVPFTIAMFAFIGLIYSLIIGAIVKKDKPASL